MTRQCENLLLSDWLTSAGLAKLKLNGLPKSKSKIAAMITREDWVSRGPKLARRRSGRGGGIEYHINNLPSNARHDLALRRHKHLVPCEIGSSFCESQPENYTPIQSIRRDARLEVLAIFETFHAVSDLSLRAAEFQFAIAWKAGAIQAPGWVKAEIKSVSAASLQRWRKARNKGLQHDLGGKYKSANKSVLARSHGGEMALLIGALIVNQPHLTADHIRDIVRDKFGDEIVVDDNSSRSIPPVRTFQRFIARWKNENRTALLKITNPDRFKGSAKFSGTNMNVHVVRLNQLWEIDASPSDVMTIDGRMNIYAVIDIFSRRIMILVCRTPRTSAMVSLLRRAIIEWGVPEEIRSDNGSDFTSYEAKRAINSLGIHHHITAPFSPQQKGTVERHIGTLMHNMMPLLPGFLGHSVADRKVIEERKAFSERLGKKEEIVFKVDLSAKELQDNIDRWVSLKYEHKAHGGLNGETPFAKAASYSGKIRKIENERALDLLLTPIAGKNGHRVVTKYGIRLDGMNFISGALNPGDRVFIRHDPRDMGRIYCFEEDGGAFIAEAICPEHLGIDPKSAQLEVQREQARRIKQEVEPLKRQIRSMKPRDMIDAVLRVAERDAGNISAFPQARDIHNTKDLSAASDALEIARDQTLSADEIEAAARAREELGKNNVVPLHTIEAHAAKTGAATEPEMDDDLAFFTFASAHPDQLNDIQRNYLAELTACRTFQQRLRILTAKG